MTDKEVKLLMQKAKQAAGRVWPRVRYLTCAQHLSFEDVVQEGVVRYLEHSDGKYNEKKSTLDNFMYWSLRRHMVNYVFKGTKLKEGKKGEMWLYLTSIYKERHPDEELYLSLKGVLSSLPDRDSELWWRHKVEGDTLRELGEEWGLTKQRVKQIVDKVGERVERRVK